MLEENPLYLLKNNKSTSFRAYLRHLELALQSVMPDAQAPPLAIPFWDLTSKESIEFGIPEILTKKKIDVCGVTFDPNPLCQYTFPETISDPSKTFYKAKGSSTTRYPFSGLQSNQHKSQAKEHNR